MKNLYNTDMKKSVLIVLRILQRGVFSERDFTGSELTADLFEGIDADPAGTDKTLLRGDIQNFGADWRNALEACKKQFAL